MEKSPNTPLISVVCITYNHELFISQAMDSFLEQETEFDIEILIADDASTDSTGDILRSYQNRHPEKVRLILRSKNIGSQNNFLDALRAAKGRYIALCEGDDFFIDKRKLQLQAEYLEKNKNTSLCFHKSNFFFENDEKASFEFPENSSNRSFDLTELLQANFCGTQTVMYRRQNYAEFPVPDFLPLDWYCHLYHAQFGDIGFIDRCMAAYRQHCGGIWWESRFDQNQFLKKRGAGMLKLYSEILKIHGKKSEHRAIVMAHVDYLLTKYISIAANESNLKEFPDPPSNPEITRIMFERCVEIEKTFQTPEWKFFSKILSYSLLRKSLRFALSAGLLFKDLLKK